MADHLTRPAAREQLLAAIDPDDARQHHALLRDIFRREMQHRRETGGDDYFENLYCCAFLLYLVGDPSDVPMMWQAKHIDFDTGTGFDVQFLLGAGVAPTLAYLTGHGHADIARAISEYPEANRDLTEWESFRRGYFYGRPS
ncbi:hypothetical protein ACQPXM_00085 [Kribbella sp. CA-253562]|uniref:hypothetical protein n=1 Tax=Kribbella sp. CA-253562 TaxID=3239942 RepID=UPI003D90008D